MNTSHLAEIKLKKDKVKSWDEYPFTVPVIKSYRSLLIKSPLLFLVGENGSGKSTFLEAIAENYGFGREGGSKHINFDTSSHNQVSDLADALTLSWRRKLLKGFFFRAESFFNVASYLDNLDNEDTRAFAAYGGKSLHKQSHGESFLSLFQNRFSSGGFFLMDEPEAALSVQRQLSFLVVIHKLLKTSETQMIIATHSPLLLAYPDAQILSFDREVISEIKYEETEAYQISKSFLNNRERFLEKILAD